MPLNFTSPTLSQTQTLLLTAFATSIATTSVILSFQALRREHRTERLKKQVGEDVEQWEKSRAGSGNVSPEEKAERWAAGEGTGSAEASGFSTPDGMGAAGRSGRRRKSWGEGEFDEGLIREQLTRNYNFLGEESMAKVRNSSVVVVGCGGVGSWCALMLLRSGVGRILLIDFDMTTLSSLNRHACATLEDVGSPKVVAMQKFLKKVAPWAKIDIHVGLWRSSPECEDLLAGADWVVDAIDNIDTKVDLLAYCHKAGIKVFSSMGSGAKRDPTRIQIADISNTYEDPLARSVRRRLRINGVTSGIPVVYSTEIPSDVKLLPLPEEEFLKGPVKELQPFDDFRVRILPVLGPLPAIFGLNIATYLILDLAGKPLTDFAEIKNRKKLYATIERGLSEREQRWQGLQLKEKSVLNGEDISLVFEDVYNGRSSLPPRTIMSRPHAVRWDKTRDLTPDNVVVMDLKEAERHMEECLKGDKRPEDVWGAEACEFIRKKSEECRRILQYRRE